MSAASFGVIAPGGGPVPLIAHIPHASTYLPPDVGAQIVLDDAALRRELIRMTDAYADRIFSWVRATGGWTFVNTLSRLVFDPERFVDDAEEPMAARGQGVVYTRTTDGGTLAEITPEERARRIREYYEPYHAALTKLVARTLEQFGTAIILDCHSFATVPLPSEPDQDPDRPDLCIGTDSFHTPPALADALEASFRAEGLRVLRDRPFAGTLVPLQYWQDPRVISVMVEVRRGLYCDEATGEISEGFARTRDSVERAVREALAASGVLATEGTS
jgi:N-formylglutamate deformylase